jgi:hypothetical protein
MAFGRTSFQYSSGRKESRRDPRSRVKYRAYIRPDGGFAKWPCTVVDVSQGGVGLRLEGNRMIAGAFNLVSQTGGPGRSAYVRWKRGQQLGAEFV